VQDDMSDVMSGAQGAPSDVKIDARERRPTLLLVQLQAQLSNSTASGSRPNADPLGRCMGRPLRIDVARLRATGPRSRLT
jgi:hypothetical protein